MAIAAPRDAGRAIAAINVTPMADIMIVLLVIFMVITPLLDGDGVTLPSASNADDKRDKGVIVVSIRSDTSLSVGDEKLDNMGELALKLSERLGARSGGSQVVYLRADESLPYSAVWKVLELCREAGADQVALLSQQKVGS